jgi:curved DNA-binding protein CbpA
MPTPLPDYYAVLELPASATLHQIKRSYRRLVRLYHPDLNTHARDDRIKKLNEAYEVLSDPTRRAAYDALLQRQRQAEYLAEATRSQQTVPREPKMTWMEGIIGFVRELKKELREDV